MLDEQWVEYTLERRCRAQSSDFKKASDASVQDFDFCCKFEKKIKIILEFFLFLHFPDVILILIQFCLSTQKVPYLESQQPFAQILQISLEFSGRFKVCEVPPPY